MELPRVARIIKLIALGKEAALLGPTPKSAFAPPPKRHTHHCLSPGIHTHTHTILFVASWIHQAGKHHPQMGFGSSLDACRP